MCQFASRARREVPPSLDRVVDQPDKSVASTVAGGLPGRSTRNRGSAFGIPVARSMHKTFCLCRMCHRTFGRSVISPCKAQETNRWSVKSAKCSDQRHLPRDAAASGREMPNSSESLDVAVHQPDQSVASTHGGVGWLAGKPDPESRRLTERCRTIPRSQGYYRLTLDMVILLSTSSRAM